MVFFSLNLPLHLRSYTLTVITSQLDYSDRKGKEEKCRVLHRTGMTRSHRHLDYSLFDLHLTLDRQPDSSKLAVLLITECIHPLMFYTNFGFWQRVLVLKAMMVCFRKESKSS